MATTFKALGDPARLRALLLLRRMELTVSELTGVLGLPQSTTSGMLRVMMQAGLVAARREGRHAWYTATNFEPLSEVLSGLTLALSDLEALDAVRAARAPTAGDEFGDLDSAHVPGRSWKTLATSLLLLNRLGRVADIGVGRGDLTLLLLGAAERLYAVDREPDLLATLERRARASGHDNLTCVAGDFHNVELPEPVDLVVLSLSLHFAEDPAAVVQRAHTALTPGGRVWITELDAHEHSWVRQRLGHRRLGFSRDTLHAMLQAAGFSDITIRRGAKDRRVPRFQSLIAVAQRAQEIPA